MEAKGTESLDCILDTKFTIDHIRQNILDSVQFDDSKKPPQIQSFTAELTESQGFAARIIKLTLKWDPKTTNLPESIILKVPSSSKMESLMEEICPDAPKVNNLDKAIERITQTEAIFYSLWSKSNPSPLKIPHCWFSETDLKKGILLGLQDLSEVASQQSAGVGFTFPQLLNIAEELASLHAWSLTHVDWLKKLPGLPEDVMRDFVKTLAPMYDSVLEKHPEYFSLKKIEAIKKHCQSFDDIWYATTLHKDLNMPPVLIHGDFWAGNIFFKRKNLEGNSKDPSDEILAIYDWQGAAPGYAASDFVRIACTSISAKIRREKMKSVMQHYYNTLKEKLGKNPPFSFETLVESYNKGMKAGLHMGFGLILVIDFKDASKTAMTGGEECRQEIIDRSVALLDDVLAIIEPDMTWD